MVSGPVDEHNWSLPVQQKTTELDGPVVGSAISAATTRN